jgi:hypothetical protein
MTERMQVESGHTVDGTFYAALLQPPRPTLKDPGISESHAIKPRRAPHHWTSVSEAHPNRTTWGCSRRTTPLKTLLRKGA